MSMSIAEAQAEIRARYDKAAAIENKYPDGLTADANAEDYAEAKRLLNEIDGLEDKLAGLEDADARKRRILDNQKRLGRPVQPHVQPHVQPDGAVTSDVPAGAVKAFGWQFTEADEYKRVVESGTLNNPSNRVDFGVKLAGSLLDALMRKALVYSGSGVAGPLIRPDRVAGVDFLFRQTTLLDLIPTATTTVNAIEYYEMTSSVNNAAPVLEATATTGTTGTKPEGQLGWTLRNQPVVTIAEWLPVTNQMLADAPALRGMIDQQLLIHLQLALETQILSGNGTAPNILGILSNPGIGTIGLGAGSGTSLDAVYHAMTIVMATGLSNPTASVWNPVDFEAVRLAKAMIGTGAGSGDYLMGPPNVAGPTTVWGRPAVLSLAMPQDTCLVADFTQMMLFDREQSAIRVGLANDDFLRNIQRILAELRAAFALLRPAATVRVTGV